MTGRSSFRRPATRPNSLRVLTPLALGLILLGAGFSVHVTLGRRRLAAWDADWQVTEPHWTKGR